MQVKDVLISATATSVLTSVGGDNYCSGMTVQARSTNAGIVYIGTAANQMMELVAGNSINIPPCRKGDIYLKGTAGDYVNIMFV